MNDIEPEELNALVQRIISSGELGRSKTYAAILNYLLECSVSGKSPKEMAIAIDVLGRDSDFDVAKDSIVRVHIYHLRNKLGAYFLKHAKNEKYKIDIPKGQYIITTTLIEEKEEPLSGTSITGKELERRPMTMWLSGLAVVLLSANLLLEYFTANEEQAIAATPYPGLWQPLLDDQSPVLIVIGDYYIFGELDDAGSVRRMVREFNINSQEDLEFEQSLSSGVAMNYFNLDLSYIPTSTAFALAKIMPVLGSGSRDISVKMMSELSTADLVGNHIVYLGYLSGLGSLEDLLFASSSLYVGSTYDELYHIETQERFASSSGLSIGEASFQDYGLVSTFPSPSGHQFVFIAGMRDEGLVNVSQEATNFEALISLDQNFLSGSIDGMRAYEALYEVFGFDGTNFDADLVYSNELDTDIIWDYSQTE